MKYQIGDFSKISRLSIKTLRYYHECGLLEPTQIDSDSGYRYYDEKCLERVRIINELKDLDFPLKEIKEVLDRCEDDSDLLDFMIKKHGEINEKMVKYDAMQRKLEALIKQATQEGEIRMSNIKSEIIIKYISDIMIASIRFKGRYQEVGKYFGKLFRYCGRHCSGSPFSMYYDNDFKEEDADIEACVPVKVPVEADGIKSRLLKGGKALTVIHKGPYEIIGEAYKVLIDYINGNNIAVLSPSREIYLKGPGLILPRSPKRFITEIQLFVEQKA